MALPILPSLGRKKTNNSLGKLRKTEACNFLIRRPVNLLNFSHCRKVLKLRQSTIDRLTMVDSFVQRGRSFLGDTVLAKRDLEDEELDCAAIFIVVDDNPTPRGSPLLTLDYRRCGKILISGPYSFVQDQE